MGKPKYEAPTNTFPYKISKRLDLLCIPRKYHVDSWEGMPAFTPRGVRKSALRAQISDRVNDAAWPYLRRLLAIKRMYKNKFPEERIERIDRMIEAANATIYSKLANCVIAMKKQDTKDVKKKKGWTESEWKRHMDYINQIAGPKKDFTTPPVRRGKSKPLDELLPRINAISEMPPFKVYRRLSQETGYRDPIKVSPKALKYVPSDRIMKLASPRIYPDPALYDYCF